MSKRTLLIAIPLVALLLNGLGYLIVSKMRVPPTVVKATDTGKVPNGAGADAKTPAGVEQTEAADAYRAQEERAFARRATGLAALEAGDYRKALVDFTEAQALLGEKAHVDELIRVTEELRRHPPEPATESPRASAGRARAGSRAGRRLAAREETTGEASVAPAPVPAAAGLLIVTTTPRGLLVQVDDTGIDLTPMRTKMRPGSHRIALLDGDRKLYETTVDVKDGTAVTLQKDLSAEVAADAPRAAGAGSGPAPHEAPPTAAGAAAPTAPSAGATVTVNDGKDNGAGSRALAPAPAAGSLDRSTAPGASATGALTITSPGLYGVVWVNGRPRGYPPLQVSGLPAGRTRIDVRVNGIQKRSSTVIVQPGSTIAVEVRNQEMAP